MTASPDVIVLGAGTAGLVAAALLACQGQQVLVLEPGDRLGGFSATHEVDGFTLNLGAHVMEDPGSGITAIFAHLGLDLRHGAVSSALPVWDEARGRWGAVTDRYAGSRRALKQVIRTIVDSPFEAFDDYDDKPLRAWLREHTSDDGVIELFEFLAFLEFLTEDWTEHSASDSLYLRKLHYGERGTAGYSWWPAGGWAAMFAQLRATIESAGGEVRTGAPARVEVGDRAVTGVRVRAPRTGVPNELAATEVIAADRVVVALPIWHVLDVVDPRVLPDWYADQIAHLSQAKHRDAWINLALATTEPQPVLDRLELGVWARGPRRDRPGFFFEQTAYDPSTAPDGMHLYVAGGAVDPTRIGDADHLDREAERLEADLVAMLPGLADATWRLRQVVHDPSIGVMSKPMLVGRYRPSCRPPAPDGLWFAHETFRSRGIEDDRAARAALSAVEDLLGHRLPGLEATWRC